MTEEVSSFEASNYLVNYLIDSSHYIQQPIAGNLTGEVRHTSAKWRSLSIVYLQLDENLEVSTFWRAVKYYIQWKFISDCYFCLIPRGGKAAHMTMYLASV